MDQLIEIDHRCHQVGTGEMDQLIEIDHSHYQMEWLKWISSQKQTTVIIRWEW